MRCATDTGPRIPCVLHAAVQDAVLAACRSDLFMPNMHLISEGDIVSDLYIMVSCVWCSNEICYIYYTWQ